MQTLRCCVIDDEPLASGLIRSYIEKTPFLEIAGEFSSPRDAIYTILNNDIDIVPLLSGSGIRIKIIESMAM